MSKEKKDFFWLSYSDLMTSLFFVMLVLFILLFSIMKIHQGRLIEKIEEYNKIEEIKLAISSIDTTYFKYDSTYKKHVLNIQPHFPTGQYRIEYIQNSIQEKLIEAGKLIVDLLNGLPKEENVSYLVIVEGQASKDGWSGNNKLSYERALELKKLWERNGVDFRDINNCELVIAGSGEAGVPRIIPDTPPKNQRFLIHIIPKVGIIHYKND